MFEEGIIQSRRSIDGVDEQEKFKMYYEYREPVKTIPSHRMLAIRRGETESILYFLIEIVAPRDRPAPFSDTARDGDWTPQLELAIDDCWKRLLNPSIQGEIRLELKKRSDIDAIQVFRDNLKNLLLAAPAGPFQCWESTPACVLDARCGGRRDGQVPRKRRALPAHFEERGQRSRRRLVAMLASTRRAIAIGNGTARERPSFCS